MHLEKDPLIAEVVERLAERFGSHAFDLVDHWETDRLAIGIARPDNHGVLAYVSALGRPDRAYFLELEIPGLPGDDVPYQVAERVHVKDVEAVVARVGSHLGLNWKREAK